MLDSEHNDKLRGADVFLICMGYLYQEAHIQVIYTSYILHILLSQPVR
jgi:hypothetical protein